MTAGARRGVVLAAGALALHALAPLVLARGGDLHAQSVSSGVPRTILARGEQLAASRRQLSRGDRALNVAFDSLRRAADAALAAPPLSVMQKTVVPPSGNKHDYVSLAPYWWPDPSKPDGLPYIRRDGEVNPQSREDNDWVRLKETVSRVRTLSYAWYFSRDARYSRGAARLLRVFFLDAATRMNPHLDFGQAVLGVNTGRGTGIIDTSQLPYLVDALRLLDGAPGWTTSDAAGMHAWMRAYLTWLLESKNGVEERAAKNNHGTFYDAQVAALALFVGDSATARQMLDESARARVAAQIAPDGRMPLELERTRPLHYSLFNAEAFTMLAAMARHVNVDLWHFTAPTGGSIQQALRFLAPYADSTVPFPDKDMRSVGADGFLVPLRYAALAYDNPVFARALRAIPATARHASVSSFDFPADPAGSTAADSILARALARAAEQLRRSATALDPSAGYPRLTGPDGNWQSQSVTQWTSGFFAGTLWYMYQRSGAREWRTLAERWTVGLEQNKSRTNTHDLGFIIFNSFGHGFLLTGDPHYREVVLDASRSLVTRFNPTVGAIKSWDTDGRRDARGTWKFPVIIDNLMNLEMLRWAGTHGGDTAWVGIAERHALTSAKAHVRADGSAGHVALFDPTSGAFERVVTWQGHADSSAWSRGQAWAIHGFSAAYGRARRPELLAAAQRTADWFIAHLPADGVPYWDFRHPGIPNTERDASAAAIAASGLYDLARRCDAKNAARYIAAADRMLLSLASQYMAPATPSGAILLHSTGGRPQNVEIDVGIVYADYFFVEALLRRNGLFLE